ncbi:MAG: fibronectin type III domain-containing protein, partial [Actinomycetes bacterium]
TTTVANTGATTQWYARGLTNGQAYQFRISAMNIDGYGTPTIVSGTPMFAPSMPLNQNIVAGDRRVTVSWAAPADNGGSPISGYRIELCVESSTNYCSNANVFNVFVANTGLVNSYTVTGLTNGTLYAVRVFAINDVDTNSYPYAYEYLIARPASTPVAPNVTYTTTGNRYVILNWGGATANGYAITGYKVEQTTDNGATWTTVALNTYSTTESLRINGLTNGVIYGYRVSAISFAGTGAPSGIAYGTPRMTASAGVPNLRATVGDSQVALTWSSPTDTAGAAIVGYRIAYINGATTTVITENTLSLATNYTVFGLTNGTSYTFKVFPVTSNGYTNAGEVVARPQTVAQAPREFMSVWGNRQVSLKWIAPAVTGANADQIFGYKLEQSTDGATWSTIATVNPSVVSYVVTGLSNGVNYSFRISMLTTVGQGASSVTSSTPFGTPSAVRNLVGIGGDRKVDLTWDAPSDLGGGNVVGYRVFIYCANGTDSGVATGCGPYTVNTYTLLATNISPTQRSLTVNGLINGTNYLFLVQPLTGVNTALNTWVTCDGYLRDGASGPLATDTARCSQYSRVYWITPMGSPSAPKGLNVATAISASSTKASITATLTWTAPDWSGGDYINGYRIEQSTDGTSWTMLS